MEQEKGQDDRVVRLAQGLLSETERKDLELDMAKDEALAMEVAAVSGVKAALEAETPSLAKRSVGWERLSSVLDAEKAPQSANDNRQGRYTLAVMLLKVSAIAVTAVSIWEIGQSTLVNRITADHYTLAAGEAAVRPVLQVLFTPSAPVSKISTLLREVKGEISQGPSAIGLYRISFETKTSRDAAVEAMTARSDLVVSATLE